MGIPFPREIDEALRHWRLMSAEPAFQLLKPEYKIADLGSMPRWATYLMRNQLLPGRLFYVVDTADPRFFESACKKFCYISASQVYDVVFAAYAPDGTNICPMYDGSVDGLVNNAERPWPHPGYYLADFMNFDQDVILISHKSLYVDEFSAYVEQHNINCIEMFTVDNSGCFHLSDDYYL